MGDVATFTAAFAVPFAPAFTAFVPARFAPAIASRLPPASASRTVAKSWSGMRWRLPWNANFQCAAGHFWTYSSPGAISEVGIQSSSTSTRSGRTSTRHG